MNKTKKIDAQELYDQMKDALEFFGIHFHDMHLMKVTTGEDWIRFSFQDQHVQFPTILQG